MEEALEPRWIALYSQTGSEIVDICKKIKRKPDLVLTNNVIGPHTNMTENDIPFMAANHNVLMKLLVEDIKPYNTFITLHGYLRIVPAHVCFAHTIFNGHPGAIELYPELKGKDPQVRAYSGKYPVVGSVVHKVIPTVDEGEIITSETVKNTAGNVDEMYGLLRETSLKSWLTFFKNKEYENWI